MTPLLDQYLLFRIRTRRDKEAFGKIYDRYVQAIYRFAFLKLPSRELAEDITAETFLRCWQAIQENKEISHLRAFLYKITRNLIVDTYRRQEPTVQLSVTFSDDFTSSSIELDVSDQARSKTRMEASADAALMIQRIRRLKEDYRDVIMLRLVNELSFGDIAQVLEKKTGHVRVMYHRGMKALELLDSSEPKDTSSLL